MAPPGNNDDRGAPALDLASLSIPLQVLDTIPVEMARGLRVLPIRVDATQLFLAASDPSDARMLDEIAFFSGRKVIAYAADPVQLAEVITEAYRAHAAGDLTWRGPRAPVVDAVALDERRPGPAPAVREPFAGELSYRSPRPPADLFDRPRPRIMVVDDEPVIRRIVQQALVQRGYEVVEAGGGIEALKLIQGREPDAIVLDAMLPDVHGFEVAKRLKGSKRYQHIPILMITAVYKGWRMAADLEESYGVSGVLEKPFNLHDLVKRLEQLLAGTKDKPDAKQLSGEAQRLFETSSEAYRKGDINAAVDALIAAIAIDPLSPSLRHQLGLLYARQGHDFAAMQELEAAIDIDPQRFQTLRNLAVLYQRRGFRRKACEIWERALALAPDEATGAEIRGILHEIL
jgi:DNA-binding response OmpR family regulator